MNSTEQFLTLKYRGTTNREQIDTFFRTLAEDTLENQEIMTLTPNDDGTEYTTIDGATIKVTE